MSRSHVEVTEAELAILEMLWREPATIRQLTDGIYPRGTTSEYATVQKLLERLEAKGCVRRDKTGLAHTFAATISRGELIGRGLENLARKLCNGSLTPLLVHLTERTRLSKADREALRRLIDEA